MKKTIVLVLLLSALCRADGLNVWLYGDTDIISNRAERILAARLGCRFGQDEAWELGLTSVWYPSNELKVPQTWTAYGLWSGLPEIDVPNPIKLDWLPATIKAKPYLGGQVGLDFRNNGVVTGPIAGLVIEKIIVIEYQWQRFTERLSDELDNEHKVIFGLKWQIP